MVQPYRVLFEGPEMMWHPGLPREGSRYKNTPQRLDDNSTYDQLQSLSALVSICAVFSSKQTLRESLDTATLVPLDIPDWP